MITFARKPILPEVWVIWAAAVLDIVLVAAFFAPGVFDWKATPVAFADMTRHTLVISLEAATGAAGSVRVPAPTQDSVSDESVPSKRVHLKRVLPSGEVVEDSASEEPTVLTLTADGSLYLGNRKIIYSDLAKELEQATGDDRLRRIYLRANYALPFKQVSNLLAAVRSAGYERIGMIGNALPKKVADPLKEVANLLSDGSEGLSDTLKAARVGSFNVVSVDGGTNTAYLAALRTLIERQLRLPIVENQYSQVTNGRLFSLNERGEVINSIPVRGGLGFQLDQSMAAALHDASPFPPPPDGRSHDFAVCITVLRVDRQPAMNITCP
jgi:biopolymer transport protein ExbD